jgi:hypothetical protein
MPVTIGSKTNSISISEYVKISVLLNGQFYSGRLISLIFRPLYVFANFSAVMFCYHVIKAIKYSLISNQKYPITKYGNYVFQN